MTRVWKHSKQEGNGLLILLALADWANDDGYAWPSVDTLAHKARVSDRTVQRQIQKIESDGELRILEGEGPNGVHLYQVTVDVGVSDEQGDTVSPPTTVQPRGDNVTVRGDKPGVTVSPNTSLTIIDTPEEPSDSRTSSAKRQRSEFQETHDRLCRYFAEISGHEYVDPQGKLTAKERRDLVAKTWHPITRILKMVDGREDEAEALMLEAWKRLTSGKESMTLKGVISLLGTCESILAEVRSGRFKRSGASAAQQWYAQRREQRGDGRGRSESGASAGADVSGGKD